MQWWGASATQVLALLAVAGLAVVLLHSFRRQRRKMVVAYLGPWRDVLDESVATRLFSRVNRWLSLVVALVIVSLLSVAIGDPRSGASSQTSVVLLVDTGLTMQARDVAPSRLHVAKQRAHALIRSLGSGDRMLVASLSDAAVPLTPMTDDRSLLHDAVEALQASDVPSDIRTGMRLARDLLRPNLPQPRLIVISDDDHRPVLDEVAASWPAQVKPEIIQVASGRPASLDITTLAVRRAPLDRDRAQLLIEIRNHADHDVRAELTLLADDQPIDVQVLEIAAGDRLRRLQTDLSALRHRLEARLRPLTPEVPLLPADGRAYARVPPRQRVRVLCVSSGNRYLEAALLVDEYLDVTLVGPEAYAADEASRHYDVVIFDGGAPPEPPALPAIYLGIGASADSPVPFQAQGRIERPRVDELRSGDPLLRWIALRDVNIGEAAQVALEPDDEVVAADARGPLLVRGHRGSHRFVATTFDPRQSDLPIRVAWPLLLLNAIDDLTASEAPDHSSVRAGDTVMVPVPSGLDGVEVVGPDDAEHWTLPVIDGAVELTPRKVGFYRLQAREWQDVVAVNARPLPRRQGPGGDAQAAAAWQGDGDPADSGLRAPWMLMVMAALLLLVLEPSIRAWRGLA